MAISFVGSTSGSVGGSDLTVPFTDLRDSSGGTPSVLQNDIVVVSLCRRATSNTTPAITTPAYTAVHANVYSNSTNDSNLCSFYRIQGATPDTDVTITTTGTSNTQAYTIHVFRGVDTTTPLGGVTPTTATGTGAAAPNSPSITPTTAGSWVIATGGVCGATPSDITTLTRPANMDSTTGFFVTGTQVRAVVGTAVLSTWSSGAFDPNAFGGGGTTAGNAWSAASFVLAPAAGGGTQALTPGLFTNSQSFFGSAVATTYSLTPSVFTNTQTFFAPTVGRGAVNLAPNLFSQSQTFFGPIVSTTVSLSPSLVTNSQTFFSPVVGGTTPDQSLSAGLFTNTGTLYAPVVSSLNSITAPVLTNSQVFYGPTVAGTAGGAQSLVQQYVVNDYHVFYSPEVIRKTPTRTSLDFKLGFPYRRP